MRTFFYTIAICSIAAAVPLGAAFAKAKPPRGGGAPAPEMGSSLLGLGMVGALTYYVVRRRRDARA